MPGPALLSLRCENCNAPLPAPKPGSDILECEHCHHKHQVQSKPQPQPQPQPQPRPVHVHITPPTPSPARLGLLVPFVIVPLALAAYWLFVRGGIGRFTGGSGSRSATGGVGEHLIWESNGGPPLPVTVDGKDAFLGRVRAVHAGDQLFVGLVDGTDVHFRWRTPPLGSYSDGYQSTWFAVAAGKVVVSDAKGTIRILDLPTGREEKSLAVTDKVEALCAVAASPAPTEVFVSVADHRDQMIDVATGTLRDAPKGAREACRRPMRHGFDRPDVGGVPSVDGFAPDSLHVDGDLAVAGGHKKPGTALPEAVGFEPKGKKVLWHQPIAQVDRSQVRELHQEALDALAGGRYVAVYGVGQDGWRVAAFDARSGARLWDVQLRGVFAVDSIDEVVATPTRVLVTRTSSLDVLDAKSGALVGTVGTETYD